ncbi:MAG: hypothetical protein H0V35_12760 [Nitrospira sp.]|nr:hypothetical protein [Nitrospira sp.]
MTTNARLSRLLLGRAFLGFWPAPAKAEPAKPTDMQKTRWGFATDLGL